jgi:hypothetical protein
VPVGGVVRQQVVVLEVQQAHVAPETRVVFLRVEEEPLAARRIGLAARLEIRDVRDPLFLVDEQVVDDVEVLGVLLRKQRFRRGAVVAAVVHVHMEVGRKETAEVGGQIVVRQADRQLGRLAEREIALDQDVLAAESVLHLDGCLPGRHLDAAGLGAVQVSHLARELFAVVQLVGVHP